MSRPGDYPTPDQQLEGDDARVQRIVGDIRGIFHPVPVGDRLRFALGEEPTLVDVETVVRFVLLRGDYDVLPVLASMDEWLSNSEGLMIEDVVEWRDGLRVAIGVEPAPPADVTADEPRLTWGGE